MQHFESLSFAIMVPRSCDLCLKRFTNRQSLFKHKKKCTGAPPKPMTILQDIKHSVKDIPTFDGAEFCGEKPLCDETLLKMMEILSVPHNKRGRILTMLL